MMADLLTAKSSHIFLRTRVCKGTVINLFRSKFFHQINSRVVLVVKLLAFHNAIVEIVRDTGSNPVPGSIHFFWSFLVFVLWWYCFQDGEEREEDSVQCKDLSCSFFYLIAPS